MLRVAGLSADTSAADVRGLLGRYYNTVKDVTLSGNGASASARAHVVFGNSAERDKALVELQGATLKGAKLILSKQQATSAAGAWLALNPSTSGLPLTVCSLLAGPLGLTQRHDGSPPRLRSAQAQPRRLPRRRGHPRDVARARGSTAQARLWRR
jgi:hypothetical protein